MKRKYLHEVKEGMVLARPIFSNDKILLDAGAVIKKDYIQRLQNINVQYIFVKSQFAYLEDIIEQETKEEVQKIVDDVINSSIISKRIDAEIVITIINDIIEELLSYNDILINLNQLKKVDKVTFCHCVNVCLYSLITGINLGMEKYSLRSLGKSAILHDIGKIVIKSGIVDKKSSLTDEEYDVFRQHTISGYEFLIKQEDISKEEAIVALQHHERFDGSGYPKGIKGDKISYFSRIVALADFYDGATKNLIDKNKLKVSELYEYLSTLGLKFFDSGVLSCFLKNIVVFPLGAGVVLNSGEKGIVVQHNKSAVLRPKVKIMFDKNGRKLTNPREIDLTKVLNISIVDSCELVV